MDQTHTDKPGAAPAPATPASLLIAYLDGRDTPCPRCGYNLRSLQSAVCPECGDPIELSVKLVEPRLGPYIALLVSVCVGFGGCSLLGLTVLARAPASWWGTLSGTLLLVQWIITGIILPLTLSRRRAYRRLPNLRQQLLALLMMMFVAAMSLFIIVGFEN